MRALTRHSVFCLLAAVLLSGAMLSATPARAATEYEIKAAFILNFVKFTRWPADTDTGYIDICVLGQNPFQGALRVMMRKTVRDRRIMVREISQDAFDGCDVLFVAKSAADKAKPVLEALNGRPILTIGDHDGFISSGGAINLYLVNGKVRFEARPATAKAAGLTISSRLLKLAKIRR